MQHTTNTTIITMTITPAAVEMPIITFGLKVGGGVVVGAGVVSSVVRGHVGSDVLLLFVVIDVLVAEYIVDDIILQLFR